jgi:hypothetical protein
VGTELNSIGTTGVVTLLVPIGLLAFISGMLVGFGLGSRKNGKNDQ